MENYDIHTREKTSDKWTKTKDVSKSELFSIIDVTITNSKEVLRIKIFKKKIKEMEK